MALRIMYKTVRCLCSNIVFSFRPPGKLNFIDHVVGNQPDGVMTPVADWYIFL